MECENNDSHYEYIYGGKPPSWFLPENDYKYVTTRRIKQFDVEGEEVYQIAQNKINTNETGFHSKTGMTLCSKISVPKGKQVDISTKPNDHNAIYSVIGPTTVVFTNRDIYTKNDSYCYVSDVSDMVYIKMLDEMKYLHSNLSIRLYKDRCFNEYRFSSGEYIDISPGQVITSLILDEYKSMLIPPNIRINGVYKAEEDSITKDISNINFHQDKIEGPLVVSDFSKTMYHSKANSFVYDDNVYIKDIPDEEFKDDDVKTVISSGTSFTLSGICDITDDLRTDKRHVIGHYILSNKFGQDKTNTLKDLVFWNEFNDGNNTIKKWLDITDDYKYIAQTCNSNSDIEYCNVALKEYMNKMYNNPLENESNHNYVDDEVDNQTISRNVCNVMEGFKNTNVRQISKPKHINKTFKQNKSLMPYVSKILLIVLFIFSIILLNKYIN